MSSADDFVCPDCDDPEPHERGNCPFYGDGEVTAAADWERAR